MSESPAGTPQTDPAQSPAQSAQAAGEGSEQVTVSKQFKEEALKWKQKAEDFNALAAQAEADRQRLAQLERLAYGGGRQATDPRAERIAKLAEQAQYDEAAWAGLEALREAEVAKAELWLVGATEKVPEAKREQVRALIRSQGYQMSPEAALSMVSDPESKTLAQQLADMKAELERVKTARPNGVSPAAVTPATASAGDDPSSGEPIKYEDYIAALQRGDDRARELNAAVGSGKRKLVRG